jgi:hypothetical protein
MQFDTTPPAPPTREAAAIKLKKKCLCEDIEVVTRPDLECHYLLLTKEEIENLGEEEWQNLLFSAQDLYETFPICEHLSRDERDGDEWLSTEEAINEVMQARCGARSRERASLWLLEAAVRGQVIVRNAGYALAYRAAGYPEIWKSTVFTQGPLWSLSSLEAALAGTNEKKSSSKRGRKPKDIWPTIYVEATKHLFYESSDLELMAQADLERWITQRLEAHRESAAESTIREKASFILRIFGEAGR